FGPFFFFLSVESPAPPVGGFAAGGGPGAGGGGGFFRWVVAGGLGEDIFFSRREGGGGGRRLPSFGRRGTRGARRPGGAGGRPPGCEMTAAYFGAWLLVAAAGMAVACAFAAPRQAGRWTQSLGYGLVLGMLAAAACTALTARADITQAWLHGAVPLAIVGVL